MKCNLINVTESTGIAKKTEQPFCIRNISILSEFEQVNSQSYQRNGAGFSVVELPVSDNFFPELEKKFSELFKDKPVELDLDVSLNSRGSIITGFTSNLLHK